MLQKIFAYTALTAILFTGVGSLNLASAQGDHDGRKWGYPDVRDDYKYGESIKYLKESGYVNGFSDGTYRPNDKITRGQFIKILVRAKYPENFLDKCLASATNNIFSDVPQNDVFAKYICVARMLGISNGFSDGKFHSEYNITWDQFAKFVVRTFIDADIDAEAPLTEYLELMESYNLLPENWEMDDRQVTRGEMAYVIYKLKVHYKNLDENGDNDLSGIDFSNIISVQEAKDIAIDAAADEGNTGDGNVWKLELEIDDNVLIYKVKVGRYEIRLNAETGDVLRVRVHGESEDDNPNVEISQIEAKEIAKDALPEDADDNVVSIDLYEEDDTWVYKVKFEEFRVYINAEDGDVIEVEAN